MKTIYEIIESVAAIGSTKTKQEILEANRDNWILQNCFFYAENPRFNFYVKIKDVATANPGKNDLSRDTFVALSNLNNRAITGNAAREYIEQVMLPLTVEARIILTRIINRDLRCGAGTSISNKVWKNLIPEYPVMLASKFDAKAEKYLSQFENKAGFVVQLKEDGGRCIVKVSPDGEVSYHSRSGSTLELFGVFDEQLSRFPGMVFDGELIVKSSTGVRDRQTGNGFYTRAVRNTLTKEQAANFSLQLWDIISETEYDSDGHTPYTERFAKLVDAKFTGNVGIVESKSVKTIAECVEFYNEMRTRGEEGAIIKVANSVWEDSRSKNMCKMKASDPVDALCIGVEPGAGKYAGMIGSLICQDSTGMLLFNVGTGLTDTDRALDPSAYIGRIIECSYNEIISSKNKSTKSLFLPVFNQVRQDKTVANSLHELT